MKYLSSKIQSSLGAFFITAAAVAALTIGWGLYTEVKSDIDSVQVHASRGGRTGGILIDRWVEKKNIIIPKGVNKYRYIKDSYPDQDWLFP